ncbi:AraC family transcriptional regulator [Maribacter sp. CXY002]|uniref:AraC family transcriptional regulator n=1 Tax=Maribacter luteocoastalis TaxID=3407671 RepID=UPI003B674447
MKVYPFKIPKPLENQLVVQEDVLTTFYNKLHQHKEIQISLIVKGQGKLLAGDGIHYFTSGDIFVLGGNLPHMFQSSPHFIESHMISLFFTKNTFGKIFFDLPDLTELKSFFSSSETGFKVLSNQIKIANKIQGLAQTNNTKRFVLFLELLVLLNQVRKETLAKFIYSKTLSSQEGERLRTVVDFVIKNFHAEIQLQQIAKMAYMTPTAFCRFFKQRTNKTFFQFLIAIRIQHASQLLVTKKDLSVSEIANLSGFNSSTNFNKKFKLIKGVSPTIYRNQ